MHEVCFPFAGIYNCRDLGGIPNCHGKTIKKNKLFRSSCLNHATQIELEMLKAMGVHTIVDLRTSSEAMSMPDELLEDWNFSRLPIISEKEVSHLAGSRLDLLKKLHSDPPGIIDSFYEELIGSRQAMDCWKSFFRTLLKGDGVLFHCTQGKDRTGIAAILLLHALDCSEQDILDDYLCSNEYVRSTGSKKIDLLFLVYNVFSPDKTFNAKVFEQVSTRYYKIVTDWISTHYGSWKGYLKQGLGLQDEEFARLQELYCEG